MQAVWGYELETSGFDEQPAEQPVEQPAEQPTIPREKREKERGLSWVAESPGEKALLLHIGFLLRKGAYSPWFFIEVQEAGNRDQRC